MAHRDKVQVVATDMWTAFDYSHGTHSEAVSHLRHCRRDCPLLAESGPAADRPQRQTEGMVGQRLGLGCYAFRLLHPTDY